MCNDLFHLGVNPIFDNQVYNIGGEDLSLRQVADLIVNKFGGTVECIRWPEEAQRVESGSTVFDSEKLDSLMAREKKMTIKQWIDELEN